ncbi:hypothetical protein GCM10023191_070610 [Actinoallomurus oryzae]|uniref:Thiol:disulfide interchange protein DsbD N-terminal domain-containing protein n=1 Tax=Actinoallomurus oryzae TaxID=502180 RepID=A0ABP8QTG1_9ACTN
MRPARLLWAIPLLLTGCVHSQARPVTARFTESGVEVTITVTAEAVRAAYRPTRAGFHVYSVDLPEGGVRGLGIPTRLSVRGGLTATGRATADKPVRPLDLPSLGVTLRVYPDGPVTVLLPVRRTGRTADIVVSYGACSSGTCLAPVTDHVTTVALG